MKNEINLLPPKKRISGKDSGQARILRLISLGLLLLVTTASIGIFLITAFSPLPALREEENRASSELTTLVTKTAKYTYAQQRLSKIGSFLDTRLKYPEVINDMQSTAPQEISFSGISLIDKDVTLTATSTSLSSLNDLLNSLKSKSDKEKLYRNFTVSKLDYVAGGNGYEVGLNVTLR